MKGEKIMLLGVCAALAAVVMMAASIALAFEDVVEAKIPALMPAEESAEN